MYDAILIPGGGIQEDGTLPEWSKRRLNRALEMADDARYIIALSAYTVYRAPILDKDGFPIYESDIGAEYLMKKGVDATQILTEKMSLDTIGNAYFARMIHTDPTEMNKLIVITSAFHMERTKEIFKWIFSMPGGENKYELDFFEVGDEGLKENMLKERIKEEKNSLKQLLINKKNIKTLPELHNWLYTKHQAYATGLKPTRNKNKSLKLY